MLSVPALDTVLTPGSQKIYIQRKSGLYHLDFSLVILWHNAIEGGYFRCRRGYILALENTNQTSGTPEDT